MTGEARTAPRRSVWYESAAMWQPPERIKHELPSAEWPSAEAAANARLFTPLALGPRTARQRTWVPAMVPWRATEDGMVTRDVLDWYRRFAEGRPGVIVVEATGIRDIPSGPLLRIGHDRFVPGLRELVSTVRDASGGETLLFIQVIDFLTIKRRPPRDRFLGRFLPITEHHRAGLAEHAQDPSLLTAPEEQIRAALAALSDDDLRGILAPREVEDLDFGYRERVTDMHLSLIHI